MALTLADRVKETTTTEGTGALALAGAVNGFSSFSSRLSVGDITFYAVILGTQWEVGLGRLTAATTLERTTVLASSNADALVSFSAGSKEVFVDFPAVLAGRLADFAISEATVASAATVDLGAQNSRKIAISGTAAITSFGTFAHGEKLLRFTGACTLTHDATKLILPTGASIITAAGDTALATSDASGNWRVRHYQRADGTALGGVDGSETSIAAAATTDIGTAPTQLVQITGSTAITSFGVKPLRVRFIRFAGALTLTHNSTSLILPGSANIATAAGDTCIASSDASGNWTVRAYQRSNGTPITLGGQSLASSGYQRLPGGLTLQWGSNTPSGGDQSIGFPTSFSGSPYLVIGTADSAGVSNTAYICETDQYSPSAFSLRGRYANNGGAVAPTAIPIRWFAIGPT